jgi:GNAT superfamily N-acetyltransferase
MPYAHQVFDVINRAYSPLFGFVPLTEKQIDLMIKKFFSYIQPDLVSVILDENDRVIAFQISMPSLSKAYQKAGGRLFPFGFIPVMRAFKKTETIDFMLIGVLPEYQGKGVNAILMTDMTEACIRRKASTAESNAELEENVKVQNAWRYYDARQHKRKRIYLKTFNSR